MRHPFRENQQDLPANAGYALVRGHPSVPPYRQRQEPGFAASDSSAESNDPAIGWSEPTGLDVERLKAFLEVDMQPFAACPLAFDSNDLHHPCADASVAIGGGDHCVLDPSMNESIPDDVDETDETCAISCNDPTEAVLGE